MKSKIFTVAAATTIMVFGLQAQNGASRPQSVNGSEKKMETAFFNKTSETVKPDIKQDRPNYTYMDGKVIRQNSENPQKSLINKSKMRTKKVNQDYQLKSLKSETLNSKPQNVKSSVSVKKSDREDVATITFKVIGYPFYDYLGYSAGYHLIIDADAEMYDFFEDNYYNHEWNVLYDACEYFIPENAKPDLSNPNWLLDNEASIEIPAGFYDFAFFALWAEDNRFFVCDIVVNNWLYHGYTDDFEFKAGYEYIFTVERIWYIELNAEYDAELTDIILPPISMDLTNQEEVKVVIKNNGILDIDGDVELTYRINGGEWITPETFTVNNLKTDEEIIYTFTTKADFSADGFHYVDAKIKYDLDFFNQDDNISGYTRKPFPLPLPFVENFETELDFLDSWTVLNANSSWDRNYWFYNEWNLDADEIFGCLQVSAPTQLEPEDPIEPANDWLFTDPIIIPEAGTYNISFWAYPFSNNEKLKILYGISPNPEEMIEIQDYTITESDWNIYTKNFEINTPGNYYFAFHYYTYSTDGWGAIDFDKVKIAAGQFVGIPDIKFSRGLAPTSSCEMNNNGIISAEVHNRGSAPLSEFTLTYQVNSATPVSQTYTKTIDMKETVTVDFNQTVDFSAIGEYNIKFTVTTPNEENTINNETQITVRHYSPLTQLPFISDFSNEEDCKNWFPPETNGWFYHENLLCYYPNWDLIGVPLLSRCITLEPDVYGFSFNFSAGDGEWASDDFYVACGISGTNPYDWKPIKEFFDYSTGWGIVFKEESVMVEITEAGEYVFAIFPIRLEGQFGFASISLNTVPEHDFLFKSVESSGFARLTPSYHFKGEKTFTATLQNLGKTANDSGNIKVLHNDSEIVTQNFSFSEYGETLNVNLKPVFESVSAGNMNLKFKASISGEVSKELEMIKVVSDSTFAYDKIDDNYRDGLGFNDGYTGSLGLVYELQKADILTSISLGLFEKEAAAEKNIILAVYDFDDINMELGNKYFEVQHLRTEGNNMKGTTFDVPDTELQPGKYFFEVRQIYEENMAIAYDGDPEGIVYYITADGYFTWFSFFGYIHLRPNFGKYGVGIEELKIDNGEWRIYPNPAREELTISPAGGGKGVEELTIEKITVYNTVGQIVMTISDVNTTSYRLNVERFNSGLYFISVQTKDGVMNGKFVKK